MGRIGSFLSALLLKLKNMKELKEQIFERYNKDYNVLSENEKRAIVTFDYSDICVLVDKKARKVYFLVPLSKEHKFGFRGDSLVIDGKSMKSNMYWREYCNQVVEYQGDAPSPLKKSVLDKICANILK